MMTGGGIGGGDIKLVGLLGILYGASGLLAVLLASCLLLCCTIPSAGFFNIKNGAYPFCTLSVFRVHFYMLLQLLTLS